MGHGAAPPTRNPAAKIGGEIRKNPNKLPRAGFCARPQTPTMAVGCVVSRPPDGSPCRAQVHGVKKVGDLILEFNTLRDEKTPDKQQDVTVPSS